MRVGKCIIREIDDDMLKLEMELLLQSHEKCKGKLKGQHNFQVTMMKDMEDKFVMHVEELQKSIQLVEKV